MPKAVYTRTVSNDRTGDTVVQREQVSSREVVDAGEFSLFKAAQLLWYVAHLITIILFLRFVFLLLGANLTGIVLFIYNLSSIFVLPFRGIFPTPRSGEFYFDTAAILGILMYYLIAFIITKGLSLLSKDPETDLTEVS